MFFFLQTLLLHSNDIASLKSAAHNLPHSLTVLSLAGNSLCDLNEVKTFQGDKIRKNIQDYISQKPSKLIVLGHNLVPSKSQ